MRTAPRLLIRIFEAVEKSLNDHDADHDHGGNVFAIRNSNEKSDKNNTEGAHRQISKNCRTIATNQREPYNDGRYMMSGRNMNLKVDGIEYCPALNVGFITSASFQYVL